MKKSTKPVLPDHGLELLLAYDGRIEQLPGGFWMKFEIREQAASDARPHGLKYSFSLHDRSNKPILGFDNAHEVKPLGRNAKCSKTHDHWHRNSADKGRP